MPLDTSIFFSPRQFFVEPLTLQQLASFRPPPDLPPSLVYADGSLYFGDVDPINRVPHGKGIMLFKYANIAASGWKAQAMPPSSLTSFFREGDRYGGGWIDGVFSGDGVLISTMCSYTGPWSLGNPHGKGVMQYSRRYVDPKKPSVGGSSSVGSGAGGVVSFFSGVLWRGLSHLSPFDDSSEKPQEYTGDFHRDHNRHGEGVMHYYNGDVYEGTWIDNVRNGFGKLRCSNGEEFEGHWLDDERHGRGLIRYPDGSTFKGIFEHNKRQGPGILRLSNGDEYSGNFLDDAMTGEGVMRYRNGDVYEGMWQEGRRHGEGKYTLRKNGATMEGTFIRGLIHGKGIVSLPGVSLFSGTFHRGLRSTGSMFWLDGADEEYRNNLCYQGDWKGEQLHGKGLLWFRNGGFYGGEFQENKRHGKGNMRYPNGEEYSGDFVANVPHGWGVLQTTTKSFIKAGLWQHGKLIEGYVGGWNGKQLHGLGHFSVAAYRLLPSSSHKRYSSASESNGNPSSTLHPSSRKHLKPFLSSAIVDGGGENNGCSTFVEGGGHRFGCVIEFKGIFKNGKRDGPGILKLPAMRSGKLWFKLSPLEKRKENRNARGNACRIRRHIIKGIWKGNQLECEKGVWAFPSGEVYVGGFSRNSREDPFGKLWLPDGSVFVGRWAHDAPNGEGIYYANQWNEAIVSMDERSQGVSPLGTFPRSSTEGITYASSIGHDGEKREDAQLSASGDAEGTSRFFFGLWSRRGTSSSPGSAQQKGFSSLRKKKAFGSEHHYILLGRWEQQYWGVQRCERVVAPSVAENGSTRKPLGSINNSSQYSHSIVADSNSSNVSTTSNGSSSSSRNSSCTSISIANHMTDGTQTEAEEVGAFSPSPAFHPVETTRKESKGVPTNGPADTGAKHSSGGVSISESLCSRKAARRGPLLWEDGPEATKVASFSSSVESTQLSQLLLYPSELSVGKVEGDGLVLFPSGIMMLHPFADNSAQLAIPFRPHSPLDGYLKFVQVESGRYRHLQEWKGHEALLDSPFSPSTSAYASKNRSFFAPAPLKVPVPPSQCSAYTNHLAKIGIANPLPTWGDWRPFDFSVKDNKKYFGAPIQCSFCAAEYNFFKTASECFFCFRSSCSSCLRALDPSRTGCPYLANTVSSTSAIMSAMFPEKQKKGSGLHRVPSFKDILICADCAETISLSVTFSILWIPLNIFSSILTGKTSHSEDFKASSIHNACGTASSSKQSCETSSTLANLGKDESTLDSEHTPAQSSSSLLPSALDEVIKADVIADRNEKSSLVETTIQREKSRSPFPDHSTALPQMTSSPIFHSSFSQPTSTSDRMMPPLGIPRLLQLQDGKRYATYVGYVSNGAPHLYGELWWGTESYYVGGFSRGIKSGVGCQVLSNGEIYSGAFRQDVWNGYGSYYFADGSVLDGFFKDGEIDNPIYWGEKKCVPSHSGDPSGTSSFTYDGVGIQFDLSSGSIYNGQWKEGKKHGKGILFYGDGSHFRGNFFEDRIEGPGTLVKETSVFCGHFKNGQKDGLAVEFFSDCAVEGIWKANAGEGLFRIFDAISGDVYETSYRHGNERDDCFVLPLMKPNESSTACQQCGKQFYVFLRQHHCRLCGNIFCDACSKSRATFPDHFSIPKGTPQRVCDACFQRQEQRRSIGIRRYGSGEVYAGSWSKGNWVGRGLYTHPKGLFVVMDELGHPIHESLRNASPAVPSSICHDAAPPLSAFHGIHESSPLEALKEFIQWWNKAKKECHLQVPLSVPLVKNFERHAGSLMREDGTVSPGPLATKERISAKPAPEGTGSSGCPTSVMGIVVMENSPEAALLADEGKASLEYPVFPPAENPPQYVPMGSPASISPLSSTSLQSDPSMKWVRSLKEGFYNMPLPLSAKSYASYMHHNSCSSFSDASEITISRTLQSFMPRLSDHDITEEKMEQKMNAYVVESPSLFSSLTASPSLSHTPKLSPSLFPPTPPVPNYGSDMQVPWDNWDVAQIPFFNVGNGGHSASLTPASDSSSPQQKERQEDENATSEKRVENEKAEMEDLMGNVIQHYAACPFWRSDVIDLQEVIERGKVEKAQELMTAQMAAIGKAPPLFPLDTALLSSSWTLPPRHHSESKQQKEKEAVGWLPGVMPRPLNVMRVLSLVKATEKSVMPFERKRKSIALH